MNQSKQWIKCSAVVVGFYLCIYGLLAHFFFGYLNPWLILFCVAFMAGDVWALKWLTGMPRDQRDFTFGGSWLIRWFIGDDDDNDDRKP